MDSTVADDLQFRPLPPGERLHMQSRLRRASKRSDSADSVTADRMSADSFRRGTPSRLPVSTKCNRINTS